MSLYQLSIYVENKPGSLLAVLRVLSEEGIDINGLSVADTTEYGVLRMILSDPDRGEKVLQDAGFVVKITQVLAIDVSDVPGGLYAPMKLLADRDLNVEYVYAFGTKLDHHAMIILKAADTGAAASTLEKGGIHVLSAEEVYERLYS